MAAFFDALAEGGNRAGGREGGSERVVVQQQQTVIASIYPRPLNALFCLEASHRIQKREAKDFFFLVGASAQHTTGHT